MIIDFHRKFKKRYKTISIKIRRQFDDRLTLFETQPFHTLLNNHPLSGGRLGQWSINVTGDWRAIYIFRNAETVIFVDLDTHSNLYK